MCDRQNSNILIELIKFEISQPVKHDILINYI